MIRRFILILLIPLFLLFAYFQLNDPDSLIWTIYYILLAFMALLSVIRKNRLAFIGVLILFTLGYMVFLSPDFWNWMVNGMPSISSSMKKASNYVEVVREFLGLGIGLIFLILLLFDFKKQNAY